MSDAAIYLLNPEIIDENGEWEAWFFADWLPGADRYPSFRSLMESEFQNSLELWNSAIAEDNELTTKGIQTYRHLKSRRELPKKVSFILAIQRDEISAVPRIRTTIYDDFVNLRQSWTGLAIQEASRWLLIQAFDELRGEESRLSIKFQAREHDGNRERRVIIWDAAGQVKYLRSSATLEEVCQWIASYINCSLPDDFPQFQSQQVSNMALEICEIFLYQPPESSHPIPVIRAGKPIPISVSSDHEFSFEVLFKINEMTSNISATWPLQYQAYVSAKNFKTGSTHSLLEGIRGTIDQGITPYKILLPGMRLPVGVYSLKIILLLLKETVIAFGYQEVPFLQVALSV